jgi:hypothetical protein
MSEKKEVLNITEAYKKIVINELGGSTPGDGVSTVPAPQHSSIVAIKNEEEISPREVETGETGSDMAKGELYKLHKDAKDLYNLISSCENLEPWIFSKITVAASYIQGVKNYLEYDNFKKKGEFTPEAGGHEDLVAMKVKDMLNGESREVVEKVLRQAIFNLEAIQALEEVKQ